MPPILAVDPSLVRVSAEGTFNGEQFVNVFHFAKEDGTAATTTDIAALLTLLDGAVGVATSLRYLYEQQDSGATISRLYGRTEIAAVPHEAEKTVAISGSNAQSDLPPMLAVMLKWRTDVATRRARGRTYLPGMWTGLMDATDTDRIGAAALAVYQTKVTGFAAAWAARMDWQFVVYSRRNAEIFEGAQPWTEIVGGSPDPIIRLQRRRRQGS